LASACWEKASHELGGSAKKTSATALRTIKTA
jgi:hypothetical protein